MGIPINKRILKWNIFLYSTQVFQKSNQLDSGRGFRPLNSKLQEYQVNYRYIFEVLELC